MYLGVISTPVRTSSSNKVFQLWKFSFKGPRPVASIKRGGRITQLGRFGIFFPGPLVTTVARTLPDTALEAVISREYWWLTYFSSGNLRIKRQIPALIAT